MNGKILFNTVKPILNLLVLILRVFPKFFKVFMFDILSIYSGKIFVGFRYIILKSLCKDVGENVYIGKYVTIKNHKNISIGDNVSLHDYCYLDGFGGLSIGNDVSIAHNSSILTTNHTWDNIDIPIKYNVEIIGKVVINNNVWIGCGVRILAGVNISERVVVAAGAVVNRNLDGASVYGGVPAKLIKQI